MSQKIRHAYRCKPSAGKIYVRENQWVGCKLENNHFDLALDEKEEVIYSFGKAFYYVGSFTGEFHHVIHDMSESEYEKKMQNVLPANRNVTRSEILNYNNSFRWEMFTE